MSPVIYAQTENNSGIVFTYQYIDGDKYTINAENKQTVLENDRVLRQDVKLKNHISLEIKQRLTNNFFIKQTTEFTDSGQLVYEEKSEFYQHVNGVMEISQRYVTPLVRGIPRFVRRSVVPLEKWTAKGVDTIVVPGANISAKIPVDVRYQYLGVLPLPAVKRDFEYIKLPVIEAHYNIINYVIKSKVKEDSWEVQGDFQLRMWWNHKYGRPEYYDETYEISLVNLRTKRSIQFSGEASAQIVLVEKLERETHLKRIQNELVASLPNAEVFANPRGLTITLSDIFFLADSDVLRISERDKIEVIARILRKYPNRRILVEGHTALAGSEKTRQKLSVSRAKAVKDYLQNRLGSAVKIIFRGFGANNPVAPNTTEKNKRKNRRVEITILEN